MKTLWLLAALACLGLLALACGGAAASAPAYTGAGLGLYQVHCAACHGAEAAGGARTGGIATPNIRAQALTMAFRGNVNAVKLTILDGKDAEGEEELSAGMPRFAGQLSDAETTAIIEYLRTLS